MTLAVGFLPVLVGFPLFAKGLSEKGNGTAKATECKSRRRRDEKAPWALNYESGEGGGDAWVQICHIIFITAVVLSAHSQHSPARALRSRELLGLL